MSRRFARIRLDRLWGHPPVYWHRWFPVVVPPANLSWPAPDGYVWIDAIGKVRSMGAEQLEIQEAT